MLARGRGWEADGGGVGNRGGDGELEKMSPCKWLIASGGEKPGIPGSGDSHGSV